MPPIAPTGAVSQSAIFVSELQGLDGSFVFSELILQKLWLRGEFLAERAYTEDGRKVRILHPGRWNRQGGPDFRAARLELDGQTLCGDIEIHVHACDWVSHGHASDPEYDAVVLHVVLFPPPSGSHTRARGGAEIPVLSLLTLLREDVEALALDDAAERLAGRPGSLITDWLAKTKTESLRPVLLDWARRRWREKIAFAALRVSRLGWRKACHHGALECLGYSGNRAAMLALAGLWPLELWEKGDLAVGDLFESVRDRWRLRLAGRPANHPLQRLRQYSEWVRLVPDWPLRLQAAPLPEAPDASDTRAFRKDLSLAKLREKLSMSLCADQLGGGRFDSFICDVCLPLRATLEGEDLFELWFHWFPGDIPDSIRNALREAREMDAGLQTYCNGASQGLFAWLGACRA